MQNLLLLLLAIVALTVLACNTSKNGNGKDGEETPEAPDPYAPTLHDIWVLETMDGNDLDRSVKRPQLELFPEKGTIGGTGGCNKLFGQMEALGWEITFRNIGTTKMFCPDLMDTESSFLKALEAVDHYQIRDLKLILLEGEDVRLILQKVD